MSDTSPSAARARAATVAEQMEQRGRERLGDDLGLGFFREAGFLWLELARLPEEPKATVAVKPSRVDGLVTFGPGLNPPEAA